MSRRTVPSEVMSRPNTLIGNLSLMQVILIVSPFAIGFGLYLWFPPSAHLAAWKAVATAVLVCVLCPLAQSFEERTVWQWLRLVLRFYHRPRRYFQDESPLEARPLAMRDPAPDPDTTDAASWPKHRRRRLRQELTGHLTRPGVSVSLKLNSKGALNVVIIPSQKR